MGGYIVSNEFIMTDKTIEQDKKNVTAYIDSKDESKLYINNKLVQLQGEKFEGLVSFNKVEVLDDIVLAELGFPDQSNLAIFDSNGNVLFYYIGSDYVGNSPTRRYHNYTISGKTIKISSIFFSQDPEYSACVAVNTGKGNNIAVNVQKIEYLGNNKFSSLTNDSTITYSQYVKDKKYNCKKNTTAYIESKDPTRIYINNRLVQLQGDLKGHAFEKVDVLSGIYNDDIVLAEFWLDGGFKGLAIFDSNGNVLSYYVGSGYVGNLPNSVKLAHGTYNNYVISGKTIKISSIFVSQDPEYSACFAINNGRGNDTAIISQKMEYLGNNKFSELTDDFKLTYSQYVNNNKYTCN